MFKKPVQFIAYRFVAFCDLRSGH